MSTQEQIGKEVANGSGFTKWPAFYEARIKKAGHERSNFAIS